MNKLLLTLIITFYCTSGQAADRFEMPPQNNWTLEYVGTNGEPSKFAGTMKITGVFSIEWKEDPIEPYIHVKFKPDRMLDSIVPVFTDHTIPDTLDIYNSKIALEYLIKDKNELDLFITKNKKVLKGKATIKISELTSAVDCNHRFYGVKIIDVLNTNLYSEQR